MSYTTTISKRKSPRADIRDARKSAMKRGIDVAAAATGLVLLAPVLLVVALLIKSTSRGPILFRQERVGQHFRLFDILKFRTMQQDAEPASRPLTVGKDSRITPIGQFLRSTKIDELPQLLNVLKGDMSLVGPRPELARYVEMFREDYQEILRVRPGITDIASLKFRNEATLLGRAGNPEREYVETILPTKIALAKQYVDHSSLPHDLRLIRTTIWTLLKSSNQI